MKIKWILSLLFTLGFMSAFAQKGDKVKIGFKDATVYANNEAFLSSTCKKYTGDPCTFSKTGTNHKAFVVKNKSYTTMVKKYNQSTKKWYEDFGIAYYLHITFIDSEENIYSTGTINDFLKKVYSSDIFNEDGSIDSEKLKIFILENGEEEPRN